MQRCLLRASTTAAVQIIFNKATFLINAYGHKKI
jgi:hypothetical protein